MRKLNAKKLITIIAVIYLIGTAILMQVIDTSDVNRTGKIIINITYVTTLLVLFVLLMTNGRGFNFKRSSFLNPVDRYEAYKKGLPLAVIFHVIGLVLTNFVFKGPGAYKYDFVTILIVLLVSWNAIVLSADRIEQVKDDKHIPVRKLKK